MQDIFYISEVDRSEYDVIFRESPDWSIFTDYDYYSLLSERQKFFIVSNQKKAICGYILHLKDASILRLPLGFLPHNPIMRSSSVRQYSPVLLQAERFLIQTLTSSYGYFEYISSIDNPDVRSSLFLEFEDPQISLLTRIRYSAAINLEKKVNVDDIRLSYRNVRRQEIRKASKMGYTTDDNYSLSELVTLYKKTFGRQNISVDDAVLHKVHKICEFAQTKGGFVVVVRDPKMEVASAVICLCYKATAYSIFILNNPSSLKHGCSSLCVNEAICRAKQLGLKNFDFVGANSPGRGDFKLSFGAALRPYFQLKVSNGL